MNKLRQWINKDDGRLFQVGNENLNYLQIIGYGFMIAGLLLIPIRQQIYPNMPTWISISAFIVSMGFLYAGELKKKRNLLFFLLFIGVLEAIGFLAFRSRPKVEVVQAYLVKCQVIENHFGSIKKITFSKRKSRITFSDNNRYGEFTFTLIGSKTKGEIAVTWSSDLTHTNVVIQSIYLGTLWSKVKELYIKDDALNWQGYSVQGRSGGY